MTHYVLWGVLIVSGLLLVFTLFRSKYSFYWLGHVCLQIAFAAFLIYFLNLFSSYTQLTIPLNAVTVGTVGLLGIPGLCMLAAVKLVLL
ncbi:pro-sigmaK processing inhibitor BofA family protein [Paenibacillus hamazuiensis]|uniref:pro-sigmaK processing inhibitor BofA family protein n=1 Tax=Paenibacillus hamazuiensis TaxID=2936508 RepID=UPI00200C009B|nr:pro-sigmaK processing inhibitor BofA family protein [Paenibacillus hamazuiensis]